jgi:hypothetical protein
MRSPLVIVLLNIRRFRYISAWLILQTSTAGCPWYHWWHHRQPTGTTQASITCRCLYHGRGNIPQEKPWGKSNTAILLLCIVNREFSVFCSEISDEINYVVRISRVLLLLYIVNAIQIIFIFCLYRLLIIYKLCI